jgi:hypothetical protein
MRNMDFQSVRRAELDPAETTAAPNSFETDRTDRKPVSHYCS